MVESRRYQVPPIVWAILLGLTVTLAGSLPWSMLVVLNQKYGARCPWASVVAVAYLVAYFKYLNGSGPPRSTAADRAKLLRARGLPRIAWRWALAAGGSANAALAALFILVSRIGWIPGSRAQLPVAPWWSLAAWLLTGAAVAGIAEECGFRGYMQKMLEDRYGALVAITVSSVVFGAMHLSHGFSVAILFDAAWGVVYGALAYLTGSILPSVVLHASLDSLEFFLAWRFPSAPAPPLVRFDSPAWFALAMAVVLSAIALWSFQKLRNLRLGE
jgi:membrane protease YdiL (CAAX protease family)